MEPTYTIELTLEQMQDLTSLLFVSTSAIVNGLKAGSYTDLGAAEAKECMNRNTRTFDALVSKIKEA